MKHVITTTLILLALALGANAVEKPESTPLKTGKNEPVELQPMGVTLLRRVTFPITKPTP